MLKYLSKVRIEFNAMDPLAYTCLDFLALCGTRKAMESNPKCKVAVKRLTDDGPAQIGVTFVNGGEEVFDPASTSPRAIRTIVLEKGVYLEAENMFRKAGYSWPVLIPPEELYMPVPSTEVPMPSSEPKKKGAK